MSEKPCALTVVIASVESDVAIEGCIESIQAATAGLEAELLVVDSSRDSSARRAKALLGESRVVHMHPGALVPELWARGISMSSGRVVALTIAQCRVPHSWARALLEGLEQCAGGIAGSIDLSDEATARDRAIFYLRYSEFLKYRGKRAIGVHSIPADNAAYGGADLRRYLTEVDGGFWEVDFHQHVSPRLGALGFVDGAQVAFGGSPQFGTLVTHRFRHGAHSGAWRTRVGAKPRWAIVVGSPLVPFLLLARATRRVARDPRHRQRFATALVPFLVLAIAWALGEAWGAARGEVAASRAVA